MHESGTRIADLDPHESDKYSSAVADRPRDASRR